MEPSFAAPASLGAAMISGVNPFAWFHCFARAMTALACTALALVRAISRDCGHAINCNGPGWVVALMDAGSKFELIPAC